MRCLVYALGGGLGHLTRGIAVARAAGRRGIHSTILSNSPFAQSLPVAGELQEHDQLGTISPQFDRDQVAARLSDILENLPFDLLVVDTFPRGLGGELADRLSQLSVPKVFVHRDLNERYAASYHLAEFVQNFDRLLMPGENGPLASHPAAVRTERWLIRDAHELLSRDAAKEELFGKILGELPIILVAGSGRVEEMDQMSRIADWLGDRLSGRAHIRFSTPTGVNGSQAHWPLIRLFPGVDVLVGAGGYNTVSEARATQTPLLAFARKRQYDRQQLRLNDTETVTNCEALLTQISDLIGSGFSSTRRVDYSNGTHQAVEVLASLL